SAPSSLESAHHWHSVEARMEYRPGFLPGVACSYSLFLNDKQYLSSGYGRSFLAEELPYRATDRCVHREFHFHGFDYHNRFTHFDTLPFLDQQLPHRSGYVRANGLCPFRQVQLALRVGFLKRNLAYVFRLAF